MRRAALMWLIAGFSTAGVALVLTFAVAVAVLGASLNGCTPGAAPATSVEGPTPSAYALQSIPPERLKLYEAAGQRFDVDWSFLASIGAQECGNGKCAGVNPAGCAGPMQIAYVRGSECSPDDGPTLWETYAVNADPGHPLSINDPADAIFTAARILRQAKGAPPTGGTFAEYHEAACHYYGACGDATVAYAEEVMARAAQYGFNGSGAPKATDPPLSEPVGGGCEATGESSAPVSGNRIVRIAESQLGQGGHPPGSDCTIFGPCEEWCSLFASWVWQRAGVPLPGSAADYGYSGSLYSWVKKHSHRVLPATGRPSPGDTVFFGTGPGESVHVAIVQRVYKDGRITTIDGNDVNDEVGLAGPFLPSEAVVQGQHIYGYAVPPAPREKGESDAY